MISESALRLITGYRMLESGDRVVVGLSGGADSVCLLHLLCSLREKYSLTLTAAHVNHGIRGEEAARDENFCRELCERLNVELQVLHADVPGLAAQEGLGIEECGRRVRYEFFNSVCGEKGKIAVAHNMNDVAETLIFNLTRGTALKGAGSIAPVRDNIIRPLLETQRSEIEEYLKENSLSYVTDSTNLENAYVRNKIRNLVIPVLGEINPEAVSALAAFSRTARADDSFLDSLSEAAYERCFSDGVLDRVSFSELDYPVKSRVAAKYLKSFTDADILSKHISDFIEFAESSSQLQSVGALRFISRKGLIMPYSESAVPFSLKIEPDGCFHRYAYGEVCIRKIYKKDLQILNKELLENCIDCDKIHGKTILRSRSGGDVITLHPRKVTKTLKKLFNEDGVAPELRNTVAVLEAGGEAVWVEGYGAGEQYRCDADTESAIIITLKQGEFKNVSDGK